MHTNTVAVIIPCYRQEEYLPESVGSVLAQTRRVDEILIVDDGSDTPDKTSQLEAIARRDPHIRILSQENSGLASARNRGIAETTAEFILPLDADDALEPRFIERCLTVLEETPGLGFVYTWVRCFGAENYIWQCPPFEPERLLQRNLLTATALYRRVMWESAGGYDPAFDKGIEDWDFWITAYEKGWPGACVPEVLFNYRQRPDSMIRRTLQRETRVALVSRLMDKHPDLYRCLPGNVTPETLVQRLEEEDRRPASFLDKASSLTKLLRKGRLAAGYTRFKMRPRKPGPTRILMELNGLYRGGLEQIALHLASGFRQHGIETIFFCTREAGPWADRAQSLGCPVEVAGEDAHASFICVLNHYNPSLLMSHASRLCTPWAVRAGVPVVWVIHNCYAWYHPADWTETAELARQIKGLIAVSEECADYFARNAGLPRERLTVIPDGVEPPPLRGHAQLNNPLRLLYLGRYHPSKGPAPLIEAVSRLIAQGISLRLDTYGDTSADTFNYRRLQCMIDSRGLSDIIRLHDASEWSPARFAEYDALVNPAVMEGWGLSATEAACAGLPVVMTRTGAAPELLKAGAAIEMVNPPWTPPLDYVYYQTAQYAPPDAFITDLSESIQRVIKDDLSQKKALIQAESLTKIFSLERMVNDYIEQLNTLIHSVNEPETLNPKP